jgi:hypothetical protein
MSRLRRQLTIIFTLATGALVDPAGASSWCTIDIHGWPEIGFIRRQIATAIWESYKPRLSEGLCLPLVIPRFEQSTLRKLAQDCDIQLAEDKMVEFVADVCSLIINHLNPKDIDGQTWRAIPISPVAESELIDTLGSRLDDSWAYLKLRKHLLEGRFAFGGTSEYVRLSSPPTEEIDGYLHSFNEEGANFDELVFKCLLDTPVDYYMIPPDGQEFTELVRSMEERFDACGGQGGRLTESQADKLLLVLGIRELLHWVNPQQISSFKFPGEPIPFYGLGLKLRAAR